MPVRIPFDEDLPLSLAVVATGKIAMIAGQLAPPGTPQTVHAQTLATLECLDEALKKLGVTRAAVVRCLCFLSDLGNWAEFNKAYSEFFTDALPTRITVGVQLQPGVLVEIEAMVELPT